MRWKQANFGNEPEEAKLAKEKTKKHMPKPSAGKVQDYVIQEDDGKWERFHKFKKSIIQCPLDNCYYCQQKVKSFDRCIVKLAQVGMGGMVGQMSFAKKEITKKFKEILSERGSLKKVKLTLKGTKINDYELIAIDASPLEKQFELFPKEVENMPRDYLRIPRKPNELVRITILDEPMEVVSKWSTREKDYEAKVLDHRDGEERYWVVSSKEGQSRIKELMEEYGTCKGAVISVKTYEDERQYIRHKVDILSAPREIKDVGWIKEVIEEEIEKAKGEIIRRIEEGNCSL